MDKAEVQGNEDETISLTSGELYWECENGVPRLHWRGVSVTPLSANLAKASRQRIHDIFAEETGLSGAIADVKRNIYTEWLESRLINSERLVELFGDRVTNQSRLLSQAAEKTERESTRLRAALQEMIQIVSNHMDDLECPTDHAIGQALVRFLNQKRKELGL